MARYVTIREASALARRSPVTVRRWVQAGRLQPYRSPLSPRIYLDAQELSSKLALHPHPPRVRRPDHD